MIAAALLCKGKTLKPANFAEHIDFKPAQTMEEAVEFAKKHLGIKNFNLGDDVEMANWVNEGLVNISNRFKGKANMPKNVIFDEKYFAKNPDAMAYHCAQNETIAINKAYYDGIFDKLNKLIEKGKVSAQKIRSNNPEQCITSTDFALSVLDKKVTWIDENHLKYAPTKYIDEMLQGSIVAKIDKFKQNPNAFSRFEVSNLIQQIQDLEASAYRLFNEPLDIIRNIAREKPEFFKNNFKDLSYYEKLSGNKQLKACLNMMNKYHDETKGFVSVEGTVGGVSKFGTIWHEMGHLLHDMNTSLKDQMWGRLSGKSAKVFLADSEKLKTAGKISWYAKTNPYEFVAETFSALCAGKKLPDDVMKLYEYYKGPMIPNM